MATMTDFTLLVERVLDLAETMNTNAAFDATVRATVQRSIMLEFGGAQLYVAKRSRPWHPTATITMRPYAPAVRVVMHDHSVSRATAYRWVRGK